MKRLVAGLFALVIGVALGLFIKLPYISPAHIDTETKDTKVIEAVARTQKVELLHLGVQGIAEESTNAKLFDMEVPGTTRALFLQYNYRLILGIDGQEVKIRDEGEHKYHLDIPVFKVLGHSDVSFQKATEKNGIISMVTPQIDVAALATEILTDQTMNEQVTENQDALRDQTKVFFDGIIKSIDPLAQTDYHFVN